MTNKDRWEEVGETLYENYKKTPRAARMNKYLLQLDGDMWMVADISFVDIQESDCAFGRTPNEALSTFQDQQLAKLKAIGTPPLDVQALTEQLEQIIHERLQWCEHCNDQIDEPELGNVDDLTKRAVKEVLALFGLGET